MGSIPTSAIRLILSNEAVAASASVGTTWCTVKLSTPPKDRQRRVRAAELFLISSQSKLFTFAPAELIRNERFATALFTNTPFSGCAGPRKFL
jgi:hypothetical protein